MRNLCVGDLPRWVFSMLKNTKPRLHIASRENFICRFSLICHLQHRVLLIIRVIPPPTAHIYLQMRNPLQTYFFYSTAKTERNSHHVGREDRACKWAVGGECSRDLHGKSSVRDGDFRSTEKPFIPADHHAKIKSKSKTVRIPRSPSSQSLLAGSSQIFSIRCLWLAVPRSQSFHHLLL
jgi:hypothetical protein